MRQALCLMLVWGPVGCCLSEFAWPEQFPPRAANGAIWDVEIQRPGHHDNGAVATGGAGRPVNGFGYLSIETLDETGLTLTVAEPVRDLALTLRSDKELHSDDFHVLGGVLVDRRIHAFSKKNYLRYLDSFTNVTGKPRVVHVAFGGGLATLRHERPEVRGAIYATGDGDVELEPDDRFLVMHTPAKPTGASVYGPAGVIFGTAAHTVRRGFGDPYSDSLASDYPGLDPGYLSVRYELALAPGQTIRLLHFLLVGLPEEGPETSAGSETETVTAVAKSLAKNPDVRNLSERERRTVVNWKILAADLGVDPPEPFSVVEAGTDSIRTALVSGQVTAEEITTQYLARIQAYDSRASSGLNAFIHVDPTGALERSRQLDRDLAAGGVPGPLAGSLVAVKDSIDVKGMPTSAGAVLLKDAVAAASASYIDRLEDAGAIVIGKTNLDEFSLGGSGVSTRGGQTRNAYAPDRSPGGSSSGSAVAVAANLATIAVGGDTCDSLTNPAGYSALSTLRPTVGTISLDRTVAVYPGVDVVAPLGRTVGDVRMAFDVMRGRSVGADANDTQYSPDRQGIRGARIGVLYQLMENYPETSALSELFDRTVATLRANGATVIEERIDGLQAQTDATFAVYPVARFADALDSYLAHTPEAAVRSFNDLLDRIGSGQLLPLTERVITWIDSQRDSPTRSPAAFQDERNRLAGLIESSLRQGQLDALLYATNLVRPPSIVDGRYPFGNCAESAFSGLPHVAVPAGNLPGTSFPVGIAFLGQRDAEQRLFSIAADFEKLTRYRRPPSSAP